jgi:hypothetical protein
MMKKRDLAWVLRTQLGIMMQNKPPDVVGDDKLADWTACVAELREHIEAENVGSMSDIREDDTEASSSSCEKGTLSTPSPTLFILRPLHPLSAVNSSYPTT